MARGEGHGFAWLGVILGLAFVVAAAFVLLNVVSTTDTEAQASADEDAATVVQEKAAPQCLADYSWSELAQIARACADGSLGGDAVQALAEQYRIFVGDTKDVVLSDGTSCTATLVGVCEDEGAGLTFMLGPITERPMNTAATNVGGWEASELRAWLASEGMALLPDELASVVVEVEKPTNNVGVTSDAASVTYTADKLWLFSACEVCGTISWFVDEYGSVPQYRTEYVDFNVYDALLSSEGAQYSYFAQLGVSATSGADGALSLSLGSSSVAWWYRTSYPYSFRGEDAMFFYQVMESGFPSSVGQADQAAGVVVGFCL